MSDIVERLTDLHPEDAYRWAIVHVSGSDMVFCDAPFEAADEITKLRGLIAELLELPVKHPQQNEIKDRARDVLGINTSPTRTKETSK